MKLREYMKTRAGEYSLAESTTSVALEDLDRSVADQEIEEYSVGIDARGREKMHIYMVAPHVHVLTRVAERVPVG